MHRLGDFDDLALEQAAGVRIGQHDRGDVRAERRAHRGRADGSVGARRHRAHGKADQRGGRRVRAVRGIRDQNDVAAGPLAVRRDRRLDRHHAAEFAVRARLRRHRDRAHAGHLHQEAREPANEFQRALRRRDRLQRMHVGEAGQASDFFVQPGIMLHRAGAERVDPGVDRIIHARQPDVVADRLRLGQPRQADRRDARMFAEPIGEGLRRVDVDPGRIQPPALEDQRLLHFEGAIAGEGPAGDRRRFARLRRASLLVHGCLTRESAGWAPVASPGAEAPEGRDSNRISRVFERLGGLGAPIMSAKSATRKTRR